MDSFYIYTEYTGPKHKYKEIGDWKNNSSKNYIKHWGKKLFI